MLKIEKIAYQHEIPAQYVTDHIKYVFGIHLEHWWVKIFLQMGSAYDYL